MTECRILRDGKSPSEANKWRNERLTTICKKKRNIKQQQTEIVPIFEAAEQESSIGAYLKNALKFSQLTCISTECTTVNLELGFH